MTESDRRDLDAEAPGTPLSRLSAAVLRISASLDVDTVLREVVESARALTGARLGVIATVDEAGLAQGHVASGLTEEEARRMAAWPDAMRLFAHLRALDGPLRLPDLGAYVASLGLAPGLIPCRTFQGTPMRHRGLDVGHFFLGEKAGGAAFTDEDEEVLVLFAAQAAIAIANARAHRDERRARADLEALVETSPVGVVVFDAQSGNPLTVNREAKRILAGLLGPDGSLEDLREVLTSRLADGREVTLDELKSAEPLRAAEVELSVPDGRSLRMLVNATPIRSGAGEAETVVVTLQDLAPLEELERLRASFLGMVSHELRAPLAAIRGSAVTLMEDERELDAAERREFHRIIVEQSAQMRRLVGDLLDAGRIDAGKLSVEPEPREVAVLVEQARTAFQSGGGRQAVRIDLAPDLPRVMADERRIVQVLANLFSNAARHAPESSPIRVEAVRAGLAVAVSVTDEGPGIHPERMAQLFRRYADAAGPDAERRRRGSASGSLICKGLVEAHGGRIRAESAGRASAPASPSPCRWPRRPRRRALRARRPLRPEKRGKTPVLVVDDDPQMLRRVRDALAAAGYDPVVTGAPEEVAGLVRAHRPQLVVLDLVLPGTDGIELMQTVPALADLPVIFISAYGRDETVVRALEAGAADYVVKPFSDAELAARVRAALRRRAGAEPFVLGALAIDYERRRVTVGGRAVQLTLKEYELLRILSLDAGRVVSFESLLRRLWADGENGEETATPSRCAAW